MNKLILGIFIGIGIMILLPIVAMAAFAALGGLGVLGNSGGSIGIGNIPLLGVASYFISSPTTMMLPPNQSINPNIAHEQKEEINHTQFEAGVE